MTTETGDVIDNRKSGFSDFWGNLRIKGSDNFSKVTFLYEDTRPFGIIINNPQIHLGWKY